MAYPLVKVEENANVKLKLVCDESVLTKAGTDGTQAGVDSYNENLIDWVDFFFFPKDANASTEAIAYFHRKAGSTSEHEFQLTVDPGVFSDEDQGKALVFVLVNYPGGDELYGEGAELPTLSELFSWSVTTEFDKPYTEANNKQTRFLMSSGNWIVLTKDANGVCEQEISLLRYACKMTVDVTVAESATSATGETWTPMLWGMQVYLMDGLNTVQLSGEYDNPTDAQYFSYNKNPKPYASWKGGESFEPYLPKGEDGSYRTFPMYMYPQRWEYGSPDAPDKEPYLKLVLPWKSDKTQREFYYKIMLPEDSRDGYQKRFVRNNWYQVNLDIGFLGAEADEKAVAINGSVIVKEWQNSGHIEMNQSEVGRSRYLAVERDTVILYNEISTTIPYFTSHPVVDIKTTATRPYYGLENAGKNVSVGGTSGTVREKSGKKYIEYTSNNIKGWWANTGSSITFNRTIYNNINDTKFEYLPLTFEITIGHADKKTETDYQRTITIIQYPAIYLDQLENSDKKRVITKPNGEQVTVGTTEYWASKVQTGIPTTWYKGYYGYTFVDGGAYKPEPPDPWVNNDEARDSREIQSFKWKKGERQVRMYGNVGSPLREEEIKREPFFGLKTFEQRQEYQWRTIFYTGGALEMYGVNVSVLSDDAVLPGYGRLVLGDPRTDEPDPEVLGYSFTDNANPETNRRLPDRPGFEKAPVLYPETLEAGDANGERSLRYYYSTEKSDRTRTMIAPGYRISSMFSGVEYGGGSVYNNVGDVREKWAKYRCAAYQEDGFPAGRWRLPTMGEIYMLAKLSARGAFPRLFNNGNYWSANGVIKVNSGTVSIAAGETSGFLRCVYDTWYWGEDQKEYDKWRFNKLDLEWNDAYTDEQNLYSVENEDIRNSIRNQFVWGDKPRR
jgi:hypothetical protein